MSKDYYDILGISKNSSKDEIKKAYKKLALKYHPDRNTNNKEEATIKFQEVSKAYKILDYANRYKLNANKRKLDNSGSLDKNLNSVENKRKLDNFNKILHLIYLANYY